MPPIVIFLIGLSLLGLFIWYFGTDSERRQRIIGTLLTIGLVGFCLYSVVPPKDKIKLGMDLAGGARFSLKLHPGEDVTLNPGDQEQAVDVLNRRLNATGTSDVLIAKQGDDQIIVDVPNRENQEISNESLEQLRTILTQAANLNFHLSHPADSRAKIAEVEAGEAFVLDALILPFREDMKREGGRDKMILHKVPGIVGDDVKDAWTFNQAGNWEIMVNLKGGGKEALYEMSRNNVNNGVSMAIVLDGEIISAPGFNEAIGGGTARITGDFTGEQARTLSTSMKNPLRTKPTIEHEEYFPPKLAHSAIDQGLRAAMWGLGLTAVFMLVFYRFAGIIALFGLAVNVVLLFGILAIFQADFTLTGIAGVILTIGIAIDANVIIYERLREERAAGKSISAAIRAAYEKAFSAIFDAQITTLITALVLLWLAEGAIKGFAVTLAIGILVSLFSALLVTRVCFNWLIAGDTLRSLNFMKTLTKKSYNFLGASKVTRFVSLTLVLLSVALIVFKGKSSLGIEFAGGDQIRFEAAANATDATVEAALSGIEYNSKPTIQSMTPVGGDGTIYSIRVESGTGEATEAAIRSAGLVQLDGEEKGEFRSQKIGSVVAGEMAKTSLISLIVGLTVIFAYVTLRFEYSFAVGAIVALLHDLAIAIGIVILSGRELNLIMVGAFLTIAGYSINDTIVIFDRIRENLRSKRGDVKDIMNAAINTTLSRTILTSLTTLFTVGCLFAFGGPALNDFSFAVIVGVIVGTYSSIFVASPIVYGWAKRSKTNLRREVLDAGQEAVPPTDTAGA